jgi:hypothetical protein
MINGHEFNFASLRQLSRQLDKPIEWLVAMSRQRDPFLADSPSRQRDAEWFRELWSRYCRGRSHLRRIHYVLVSTPTPILLPNGKPYENTEACWTKLGIAGLDARYLGLVPCDLIVDQRNPEAVVCLESARQAEISALPGITYPDESPGDLPPMPYLSLKEPVIPQRYHVEIWAEKSTQNDILYPLAKRYNAVLFAGAGEVSLTRCYDLARRAKASQRPVRVLYISDFDPAGQNMPVAAARKIEHAIRDCDIDLQVRPIALTAAQCELYNLPRTPIKEGEKRREGFEDQHGRGATELDALEALHPGTLGQIVTQEIRRCYDPTLAQRQADKVAEVRNQLLALNLAAQERVGEQLDAIRAAQARLAEAYNSGIVELNEQLAAVQQAMSAELKEAKPDKIEWPEPEEGEEDDDPLFDSGRAYLEQVERFRSHKDLPGPEHRSVMDDPDSLNRLRQALNLDRGKPLPRRSLT